MQGAKQSEYLMNEKTISSKTVFKGCLLNVEVLDVETDAGVRCVREIVRHQGAVAVLAELPDGRFVFVRQFRKAVEQEMLEIVAGKLEKGEKPEECARRELKEETGFVCDSLEKMGEIYLTPGYSSERTHLFFARLSPNAGLQRPDDDENLVVVFHTADEIEDMILRSEIRDAKTLAMWLLFKKKPERRVRDSNKTLIMQHDEKH